MGKVEKARDVLSGAQLEIMDVIWEMGEAGVADVWQALGKRRDVARNTVLTMMTRLEEKGWLTRRRSGNSFVYSPSEARATTHKNLLGWVLDKAFKGSTEGLLLALLDGRRLKSDEAARIRRMIEDAEGRSARSKSEGRP